MSDISIYVDDPYNDDYPAGWLIDGTPVLMHYLWHYPLLMKSSLQLSFEQKRALVKARVLKRQNYHLSLSNITFDQQLALEELNYNSYYASIIIDNEIDFLDTVIDQRIKALNL